MNSQTPDMGRPTKELYFMAELIFMMEFFDWKKPEALNAYSYHMDVHFTSHDSLSKGTCYQAME